LFFSGLSFVGFLARRLVGRGRGHAIAGVLGGFFSSTSVTLTFSRLSRSHAALGRALAAGVVGASTVLFPRVLIASAVLAPALTRALWPAFVAPVAIGALLVWMGMRQKEDRHSSFTDDHNPLQFGAAVQMAALFQVVLFAVDLASRHFGESGLLGSAAVLGLTDVDALTVSMSRVTTSGIATPDLAARAVLIGVTANTLVKLTMTLVIGRGVFRPLAAGGLAALALALAGGLILSWINYT